MARLGEQSQPGSHGELPLSQEDGVGTVGGIRGLCLLPAPAHALL